MAAPTDGPFDGFREADSTVSSGAARSTHHEAFRPGMVIDQSYRLNEVIGQGAMGVVFSCTHLVLQKDYALKFLLASDLSSEAWSRFQIEAKALARLNHRGIVGIHNMGVHHGRAQGSDIECDTPYYVMDLLSGENLDDLLKKSGPLTLKQALDYFIQVADALHSAHLQGIVHRDIKPSNLMLLRDKSELVSQIKVVDFGIARVNRSGHGGQSQTATGLVFGTPFYMSPEQCRGERVDHRADIYSFGCTLFEALTGEPPFKGNNAFQTFMMHQGDDVPSLESRRAEGASVEDFPDGLEAVVAKTLQKNPADRYQSMEQLKHDLERVKQGKDVTNRGLRSTIAPKPRSHSGDEAEDDLFEGSRAILGQSRLLLAVSLLVAAGVVGVFVYFVWREPAKSPGSNLTQVLEVKKSTTASTPLVASHVTASTATPVGSAKAGVSSAQPGLETLLSGSADNDIAEDLLREKLSPVKLLESVGASQAEKDMFRKFDWVRELDYEKAAKTKAEEYIRSHWPPGTAPVFYKAQGGFRFPSEVYLAAIQFDNGAIRYAQGDIPALNEKTKRPAQDVHVYLGELTSDFPGMLDGFRADDVTALDIRIKDPRAAMMRLRKWKRLRELSFFNGLTKSLPTYEEKLENSPVSDDMLGEIDSFSHLQSLGLAGEKVSGRAIAQMSLVRKVGTLKVKGIRDIGPLLEKLTKCDNIKELWLMSLYLQDQDLEPLTRMKNLSSLRITRSRLSPNSLAYFKRMRGLKHLKLDRSWSNEDKAQFKRAIPGYEFEPVFDKYFWKLVPGVREF